MINKDNLAYRSLTSSTINRTSNRTRHGDRIMCGFIARAVSVALLLLTVVMNVSAETQMQECGWMQRSESVNDAPLTQQEIIELREQEIIQLANQSEHCLSQANNVGSEGQQGSGGVGGGSDKGEADSNEAAGSASNAGAPLSKSEVAKQASSNHLQEGESSSSSSSVAKGTYVSPPDSSANTTDQSDSSQTDSNTQVQTTNQPIGTGIGAPRATASTANNKERLRQQLREKIATTDDPEIKKKLQERLDGLK